MTDRSDLAARRGERALRRLHARRLRPLAEHPEMALPLRPDPARASYYEPRERPPLAPRDMEIAFGRPEEMEAALERLWAGTPLAGLGRALVRIARRFRGVRPRERVSSYVYEMF